MEKESGARFLAFSIFELLHDKKYGTTCLPSLIRVFAVCLMSIKGFLAFNIDSKD